VINLHCNQCKTGPSNPWDLFKIPVKNPLLAYKSSPGIPSALLGDVLYKCKQLLNTPQVFLPLKTWITAIIVAFFSIIVGHRQFLLFFHYFAKLAVNEVTDILNCCWLYNVSTTELEIFIAQLLTLIQPCS